MLPGPGSRSTCPETDLKGQRWAGEYAPWNRLDRGVSGQWGAKGSRGMRAVQATLQQIPSWWSRCGLSEVPHHNPFGQQSGHLLCTQ